MTFAELVVAVHDWVRRLPPARVRDAVKRQLESEEGVEGCRGISVDAVLVMVRMGIGPGMRPVVFRVCGEASETAITSEPAAKPEAEPEIVSAPRRRPVKHPVSKRTSANSNGAGKALQPAAKRARALVRDQLKHGPKPAAQVEAAAQAAEIPKQALLEATDELGVRSRRGEWRLPG